MRVHKVLTARVEAAKALLKFVQANVPHTDTERTCSIMRDTLEVVSAMLEGEEWYAPEPEDPQQSELVNLLIDKEVPGVLPIWDYIRPGDADRGDEGGLHAQLLGVLENNSSFCMDNAEEREKLAKALEEVCSRKASD